MKTFRYIVIISIALFLMGCPARSLYPLFAEKNLVFNPGLVGAWIENDKKEIYLFQKSEGKNYIVIVCNEKGDTSQYVVQLGQLGKIWFMDSYPSKKPAEYQMIPTHIFSKIWFNEDTLRFASLESDHLKQLIETENLRISYAPHNDDILLTASTAELQKLVLQLAQDDRAFPKPTKLTRMK